MVELHEGRASDGRFLHYGTSRRAASTNSPEPWFGESYASIALTSSGRECGVMDSFQISLYIVYIKKKIQKYKTNKNHKNQKIRKYKKKIVFQGMSSGIDNIYGPRNVIQ